MKIHIVGGSGTGKSYFADALSRKYSIAHYDLDNLQWDNSLAGYGVKAPCDQRDAQLQQILKQDNWIIEGVYYAWVLDSFEKADRIYLLVIPNYICKLRILRRFVRRKLGIEQGKKETCKSLLALLRWTDQYQNVNLKKTQEILRQYPEKVTYIRKAKEIRALCK